MFGSNSSFLGFEKHLLSLRGLLCQIKERRSWELVTAIFNNPNLTASFLSPSRCFYPIWRFSLKAFTRTCKQKRRCMHPQAEHRWDKKKIPGTESGWAVPSSGNTSLYFYSLHSSHDPEDSQPEVRRCDAFYLSLSTPEVRHCICTNFKCNEKSHQDTSHVKESVLKLLTEIHPF